uniref:General transcription and DNA repair factor IIH helicase subunit XPD n=1 Tax=Panagrolaimus superbus TaxID=310955 RepID=A0A914Y5D2_9BILA
MKLQLDKLTVLFPYEHIYPEQYYYMAEVKKALDASGHGVIEMPCGTGKTACLLSVIVAFMLKFPSRIQKLIYCSRTIPEIEKCVEELRHLFNYYERVGGGAPEFLAIALSSRKNLCINDAVVSKREGIAVDGACQSLTSSIARARKKIDPDYPQCDFFETWDAKRDYPIPNGIFNLSDLRAFGQKKKVCPYFLSRSAVNKAHIVVYSYHYLLDPKIAEIVSKDLNPRSVVVFDEAHNIDNVCIESMSVSLSRRLITRCEGNLESLDRHLKKLKNENSERLKEEYDRLVENLREKQREREEDVAIVNPGVPDEVLQEAIPGTIRTAEHFLRFMTRFSEYIKHRMRTRVVHVESPASFLRDIHSSLMMERKALKFCSERFASLAKTLELADVSNFNPLVKLTQFATLVSTFSHGFSVIIEPDEMSRDENSLPDCLVHLSCLDASVAMRPVVSRFQSVIITSGTLSPLDMYPRILDFQPAVMASLSMTQSRESFVPLMIGKGNDQVEISSKFECRDDTAVIRNYGNLLQELSKCVPDGIVVFFPSYIYMESLVSAWAKTRLLDDLTKHKLIFMETTDAVETAHALEQYVRACESGRGAFLFSVARGKVSEGIDFAHHLGRAIVMLGIPFVYTEGRILRARLEYLRDQFDIRENDFLTFDAMRHAAQCVGRAIRGKTDYGVLVFADRRFGKIDKRTKLPRWIQEHILPGCHNMSVEEGVSKIRRWFPYMGQPMKKEDQLGVSLVSEEMIQENPQVMDKYKNVVVEVD